MSEATPEPFHLDLHAWLDAQQTSHGVRHDDYAQYHAYCTRRLSRLAHKPKEVRSHLIHSGKYATPNPDKPKTPGGRHAFCGRTHDTLALTKEVEVASGDEIEGETEGETTTTTKVVPVPIPHENILWHLLVSSERSWAHANELRKKGVRNKRQTVLKKLKRAHKWAHLLVEKAKLSADDETQTECAAYEAWMSANYAMEQMKYQVSRSRDRIESNFRPSSALQQNDKTNRREVRNDDNAKRNPFQKSQSLKKIALSEEGLCHKFVQEVGEKVPNGLDFLSSVFSRNDSFVPLFRWLARIMHEPCPCVTI
jgi:hypothetical protein